MIVYIIPITALLLAFMSLLASLRFIFSRQGLYWVFPAMISLILAALWYMMIIVFHYALKKTIT